MATLFATENQRSNIHMAGRASQTDLAATTSSAASQRPTPMTLSVLVLAAAAVLMVIAFFAVELWTNSGSAETHLVDTADCMVVAMSVPEEFLESSGCEDPADSGLLAPVDSANAEGAVSEPWSPVSPRLFVPVPGIWVQTLLRSLG